MAQALCPEAHITAAGLEECRVSPASFDAAIGNVPYSGDIKIDGMPIHDYFIRKSIESVRPGGIVAVLTSRYTLDKNSTATRRAMAEQAELLGAVRLPAETFRRQAGTEALSDILLLRRRPEPIALSEDELPEWVETSPFEDTVNINRYFNEHPGRAVGDMSIVSGPMGPTLGVSFKGGVAALGDRVSDLLRDSVARAGAAYDVRPGCQETIGTYRGLSVVCRRQHVLDDDWLPYIGLAVDPAKHVHMSERVFPSGEKGAFTVLTQMDRIIARDAKGPAEIELKLGTAQRALADAQKAAKEPFPKQAELDELEQRLAVLEQERIEAELRCQREQAQRDEAEAAAIEDGIEEERETEREHERAAAADDEARDAAHMAELRRQGLICEDSAAHNAATAVPNGVALGVPDDIAEAARCSAAASARDGRAEGEKRKAGM